MSPNKDRLAMVKFIGANKEKGLGGVTYELNSVEVAGWLKKKSNMSDFLTKLGSMADYKEQTFKVVVDWILVSFEVELQESWRAVEQATGLMNAAIGSIVWIKPVHLWSEGKRTAIAVFKMVSREDANQVIEKGLYVESKKVWGRKQVQEPRRCLKCQCFGEHKAAKCHSIHEVCG